MDLWSIMYLVAGGVGAAAGLVAVRWVRKRLAHPSPVAGSPPGGLSSADATEARADVRAGASAGVEAVHDKAESDRERIRRALDGKP